MKRIRFGFAALALLAGIALAPGAARAECTVGDCWGAIAYGPGGAWAYAVNMESRAAASAAAQGQCGGRCSNVLTFHNSCGAFATGPGGFGWGNAGSREEAEETAMEQCEARSQGCAVRVWGCTQR
jgi:Domain of unknown function (DUF4189)